MKCSGPHLFTPVYLKLNDAMPWPAEERAFYLLSRDGLFLCRNTPLFRSCVPVERFPSELAGQLPFLKLGYPRIPRRLLEQVVGFFGLVAERHSSEAAVLVTWNWHSETVEIMVPEQVGIVSVSWYGNRYPLELEYEVPPLPPHLTLLGDIHSHADGPAYASFKDQCDEIHQPGVHLVIGRILDEPPQFHCEATADGARFRVSDLDLIVEGYHRRRVNEVPPQWLDKITVKPWTDKYGGGAKTGFSALSGSGPCGQKGHAFGVADAENPEVTRLSVRDKQALPPAAPPTAADATASTLPLASPQTPPVS